MAYTQICILRNALPRLASILPIGRDRSYTGQTRAALPQLWHLFWLSLCPLLVSIQPPFPPHMPGGDSSGCPGPTRWLQHHSAVCLHHSPTVPCLHPPLFHQAFPTPIPASPLPSTSPCDVMLVNRLKAVLAAVNSPSDNPYLFSHPNAWLIDILETLGKQS